MTDKFLRGPGLLNWKGKFPVQYFVDDIHRIIFTHRVMPEMFIEIADDVEPFRFYPVFLQSVYKRIELIFNIRFTALILEVVDLRGEVIMVPDRLGNVQPVKQGCIYITDIGDAIRLF